MGNPLRILHVVVNMNRGGAETLIMNLYRNIDRSKIQFDFLTCKEGVFDEEIKNLGGKVYRIPYITDVGHRGFIYQLNGFFKNTPHKIIHSHMDKMSGLVLRAAKKMKIPIRIVHSHSTNSEGGLLARIYKWYIGNFIQKNATHFYACSQAAATWLYKSKSEVSQIIKNGIDLNGFQFSEKVREAVRKELKVNSDTFIVGHVGRFSHPKNHEFLVSSFANMMNHIPKAKLILVGDGSLREKIEQQVDELNIRNNVKFLDVRDDVAKLLQAFDIFVFPSLYEGLPVTLIEAQAAGLPCLISNKITGEVDMGLGLIHSLPIKDRSNWVKEMISLAKEKHSRVMSKDNLLQKDYDIKNNAKKIETNYMMLGEKII